MSCMTKHVLCQWLARNNHPLLPTPPETGVHPISGARSYMMKLAFHLKSNLIGQAGISLAAWLKACLFRYKFFNNF